MATTIWWVRQDLRLADNPALTAARREGAVVPVFVLDDAAQDTWAWGGAQRWWLHHSLQALDAALRACGSSLVLRRGRAEQVLPEVVRETRAESVHAAAAHEPWARRQQQTLGAALGTVRRVLHPGRALIDHDTLRSKTGGPYAVYTPFMHAVRATLSPHPPLAAPRRIATPVLPRSETLADWGLLPHHPDWAGGLREVWQPGEERAHRRLETFLRGAADAYASGRNLPAEDGTSCLSPHLHWGEISPRQIWHAGTAAHLSAAARDTFLNEIVWREFAIHLLWHHPSLPDVPMRPEFAAMPWRRDARGLRAWQQGRTGIPMVDAGMRQLWHTGWMHNRVRMIVGSFLIKHLLLPWQDGERWFWDTLVDGDLASNSMNWQWVAGCGADAAPFFRVFNPVLQGRKFDPSGAYVRCWVPELAALPDRFVHAPWEAETPPRDYPPPLVDLPDGRARALAAFRELRGAAT